MGQYVGPGNAPYVVIEPNSKSSLISKLSQFGTSKRYWLPKGTYALGADTLNLTIGAGKHLWLEGESAVETVITGSNATMVNVTDASWAGVQRLTLKNLTFKHTAPDVGSATDTTLDLLYSHANLEHITCEEQHPYNTVNKYATAIKVGPTAGAGVPCMWRDVRALVYATSFDLSLDHVFARGTTSFYASDKGYNLHDCEWVTMESAEANIGGAAQGDPENTVYPFYCDHVGKACGWLAPKLEAAPALANAIWHSNNLWYINEIHGFGGWETVAKASVLRNTASHFRFIGGHMNGLPFINTLTSQGTGSEQTLAHGMPAIPNRVWIQPTATGATETSLTTAADATNVYPTVTNLKNYTLYAEIV